MIWEADWDDVLRRARRHTVRRLIVVAAALAAVLVPLAAFASANDWWFLQDTGAPRPIHPPLVIKEGTWDGHPWQLVAYRSTDSLCMAFARAGSSAGAAMSCAPTSMSITYLTGGASDFLPAYITGPVVPTATEVEIKLPGGRIQRLPTFGASAPLDHFHFYVGRSSGEAPEWLAGLDAQGDVVACLVPRTAKDGVSALSDCR
jgi:hypothetical protein